MLNAVSSNNVASTVTGGRLGWPLATSLSRNHSGLKYSRPVLLGAERAK